MQPAGRGRLVKSHGYTLQVRATRRRADAAPMTLFATELRREPSPPDLDSALLALAAEAREHPGVRHPWLGRFARRSYRDPDGALQQFARHYHGFVAGFPACLERAMSRLSPVQQVPWQRRLARELGYLGDDDRQELRRVGIGTRSVEGVSRAMLFRRFAVACGVQEDELLAPTAAAVRWRDGLLTFLRDATPAEAVGALALGTEFVDRDGHAPLLRGVLELGTLRREEFVCLEMLCLPDERHQQELFLVARQLAADLGGLDELRTGMRAALQLRAEFHDRLEVLALASA